MGVDKNPNFVYNTCSECGESIKVRAPKDLMMRRVLENSKESVCNVCEPNSRWKRTRRLDTYAEKEPSC